jgi:nitronate monooxygenase
MMKTRFTELVGIEYPIMCGGMFQVGRAELCAAVSEAGGLGTITSTTQRTPENLRNEIRKIKDLTNKPFAVNINLFPSANPMPNDEFIDVLIEEGVKVVETSGRSPEAVIGRLKNAGIIVIHKVAGVKNAITAERLGADAVSVVGFETGGHPGMEDIGSIVLTRLVAQSVKIPVLGGGGFGNGQGLVAAMALGAEGVVMGTRFMAVKESIVHDNVKQWMVNADEYSTTIVQKSIKSPNRVALNEVSKQVLEKEEEGATFKELLPLITGKRTNQVYFEGDVNGGIWSCGQVVGLIEDIPTTKELINRIVREAEEARQFINKSFEQELINK